MNSYSEYVPDYKTFGHNVKKRLVMFLCRFDFTGGGYSEEVLMMTEQDKMEWMPSAEFDKKFKRIKK